MSVTTLRSSSENDFFMGNELERNLEPRRCANVPIFVCLFPNSLESSPQPTAALASSRQVSRQRRSGFCESIGENLLLPLGVRPNQLFDAAGQPTCTTTSGSAH